MKHALTAGQRQTLVATLRQRLAAVEQELQTRQQGLSPAEQALATREQDGNDALQLASEREVQQAVEGMEETELRSLRAALARAQEPDYGHCNDCGKAIPFGRLQVEPQALRCVACETRHEKGTAG
jgi:DnaK suppressor protein